jgi:Iap family predicted aminopeptidase
MYNTIFDFCKVRNTGNIYKNPVSHPPARVQFLIDLLTKENIDFEIDKFKFSDTFAYNLILKGNSNKIVVAHHDIVNPHIDNANDNSASVINAISIKKLLPEITVVLLDGEECGGIGSQRLSDRILDGDFGKVDWVLNLELTGRGGKHFFIGNYPGKLSDHIKSIFDCPIVSTPYNDSVTFRRNGIDSVVINPLPPLNEGTSNVKWNDSTYLDYSMLYNCHSTRDTLDTISVDDMKEFVEEVVIKILK